jgi:DNA ligase-1
MRHHVIALFLLFYLHSCVFAFSLQKAQTYDASHHIDGWLMSEKLDGIRAYWDGKTLKTRQGNIIFSPSWFTTNFPPFELDGELWTKREDFENIQSIVLSHSKDERWHEITYQVFEVPYAKGDFTQRLKKAQHWFLKYPTNKVNIITQHLCQNQNELENFLEEIITLKGEGVMLKNPKAAYESKRSAHLLKVKKFYDMEGEVVGINYRNNKKEFKSLVIQLPNKIQFNLGNGFSDEQRKEAFEMGTIITFKYYGLTKNGKPKFASYLRQRKD